MARRNTTKFFSDRQESTVADELSGKKVIASGALWGMKGDVRSNSFLVECKTTEKEYYSLSAKTWDKIYYEALKDSLRIPVIQVDLCSGRYRMAIYNPRDLNRFSAYYDYCADETVWTDKKSFRVTNIPFRIEMVVVKKTLEVISWDDFLRMTDESED